jgi:hypothetical protein
MKDVRSLDYETLRRLWRGDIKDGEMDLYNQLYRAAVTMQVLEDAFAYEFTTEVPGRRSERPRFDPFDRGGQL